MQYMVVHDSACVGFLLWLKVSPSLERRVEQQQQQEKEKVEQEGGSMRRLASITSLFGVSSPVNANKADNNAAASGAAAASPSSRMKSSQSAATLSSMTHTKQSGSTLSMSQDVVGSPPDLATALARQSPSRRASSSSSSGGAVLFAVTLPPRDPSMTDVEKAFVNEFATALQACLYARLVGRPLSDLQPRPMSPSPSAPSSASSSGVQSPARASTPTGSPAASKSSSSSNAK